ncbi:hypothetical protein [Streptomyces sp. NPDC056883]|uniref:hypothetical protein n=1 Tax=Streptomyces sp. NPDC056883 TaxID=3345959 RepID=UPI0036A7CEF6
MGVVAARVTLGALVLLPFALRRGGLVALLRRRWRALAVVELAAPFLLIAFAERNLPTGTTGARPPATPWGPC